MPLLPPPARPPVFLPPLPNCFVNNEQQAKIETEKLLALTVARELRESSPDVAAAFIPQFAAMGYEGRCAAPTRFDASYCYALGYTAAALVQHGKFGYMASLTRLEAGCANWCAGGVPITMMCHLERRRGRDKPVIKKALVDLSGPAFLAFQRQKDDWAVLDGYRVVGPVQFGAAYSTEEVPLTVLYEAGADVKPFDIPAAGTKFAVDGRTKPLEMRSASVLGPAVEARRTQYRPAVPTAIGTGAAVTAVKGDEVVLPEDAAVLDFIRTRLPCLARREPNLLTLTNDPIAAAGAAATATRTGPIKIGVCFFGRQAPGGANVVCGLHAALKARADGSELLGFFGGSGGLVAKSVVPVTDAVADRFRNMGGFEILGRTRDYPYYMSDTTARAVAACRDLSLSGLVLVGGHRTATGAVHLAESLAAAAVDCGLVLVPCGVTGEFGNEYVGAPVGHDTTAKVAASLVGNLAVDAASARKYWYFIKQFGGAGSHLVAEIALATQPNAVLLTEEIMEHRFSLGDVVSRLANLVAARAAAGKNFGVVLVPEGLITAVPELNSLVKELNGIFADLKRSKGQKVSVAEAVDRLTGWSAALLQSLPAFIQEQLLFPRQSDGQLNKANVETEKLLATLVGIELDRRKALGTFAGKYSFVTDSIDYKARSSAPSNFDCCLAYTHGVAAAGLVACRAHAVVSCVSNLGGGGAAAASDWECSAVPLLALLSRDPSADGGGGVSSSKEENNDTNNDRIKVLPTLIHTDGPEIKALQKRRGGWELDDAYCNPGPLQFGDDTPLQKLLYRAGTTDYLSQLSAVNASLRSLKKALRPGVDPDKLSLAYKMISNVVDLVDDHHHHHKKAAGATGNTINDRSSSNIKHSIMM